MNLVGLSAAVLRSLIVHWKTHDMKRTRQAGNTAATPLNFKASKSFLSYISCAICIKVFTIMSLLTQWLHVYQFLISIVYLIINEYIAILSKMIIT